MHGRPRSGRAAIKNVHLTEGEVECLIRAAKGKQIRVGERVHAQEGSIYRIFLL